MIVPSETPQPPKEKPPVNNSVPVPPKEDK